MIITAKYMAMFYDNHQGGSGSPFENKLVFELDDDTSLEMVYTHVNHRLDDLKKKGDTIRCIGEVMLLSVELHE